MSILELRKLWGNDPLIIVCVGVLIQDETGRILLQRRGDDGLWGEPGGALESGEDFLTAARRELLEETGLVCPDLHLLPIAEALQGGPEFFSVYPNGHEVYIVGMRAYGTLPASALDHAAPDDSGETLELRWFALDDLPPISKNVNRLSLSLLRSRVGLPPLPLEPTPPPPPIGNHLMDLRKLVGPRPLHAPGANVLVTDDRGRLLLLRHGGTGKWALPGGILEPGESYEQGAARELFEETGLRAATFEPLEMYCGPEFRLTYLNGDVIDSVSVLYSSHGITGQLVPQDGEVLGIGWFSGGELPTDEELSSPVIRAGVRYWKEQIA